MFDFAIHLAVNSGSPPSPSQVLLFNGSSSDEKCVTSASRARGPQNGMSTHLASPMPQPGYHNRKHVFPHRFQYTPSGSRGSLLPRHAPHCPFSRSSAHRITGYSNSKSSNSSLYFMICLLILLPTVHVTKSSIFLVTRYAGSVTVSAMTRTWPCSIIFVAAWTFSAMRRRVMTTGNRRLANALTVTCFSTAESLEAVGRMPMERSLSRRSCSCFRRAGLSGGRRDSRWASWRMDWNGTC